jgi:hypothetical protein
MWLSSAILRPRQLWPPQLVPKLRILDSVSMLPYLPNQTQASLPAYNFAQTGINLSADNVKPGPCVKWVMGFVISAARFGSGLLIGIALITIKSSPLKPGWRGIPTDPAHSYDPSDPGVPKQVQKGGSFLCSDQYCMRYDLEDEEKARRRSEFPRSAFGL